MRPEATALKVLSTTRARAKMREFRVAPEDFNALPRDPAILFALAIGIVGDIAAIVADQIGGDADAAPGALPRPLGWGEMDADPQDVLRFASLYFDAYMNAALDAELTSEFSLLCAAAYYIAGNVGSATVIVRHMAAPDLEIAGGLGYLLYAILRNQFVAIEAAHAHRAVTSEVWRRLLASSGLRAMQARWLTHAIACEVTFTVRAHRASCFTAISSEQFARSSCAMRRAPSCRSRRATLPSYGVPR
jgi:hypothetical protein